jgi:DNA-binding MltR family transcriptional regulator
MVIIVHSESLMQRDNAALTKLKAYINSGSLVGPEVDAHWKELTGTSDRLVAILAATAIEGALTGVLKQKMPSLTKTLEKSIFGHRGPLESLSAKADVAAALGLIDGPTHRNVDYIREIRNAFAHTLKPLRFTTPVVREVCDILVYSDKWRSTAAKRRSYRKKFLLAFVDTGRAIWGHHRLSQ